MEKQPMNTFFDMLINFVNNHDYFKILQEPGYSTRFNVTGNDDGTILRLSRALSKNGGPSIGKLEYINARSDVIGSLELAEAGECACRIVNEVHPTHEPTPMHEFVLLYNKFKGLSNISHVDMLKAVNLNRLAYIRQWIVDATDYDVIDNNEESITLVDLLALDKSLVLGIGDHGQLTFKRKKSQTIETICDVVYISFTDLKIDNTRFTESNDISVIITLLNKYMTWAKLVKAYSRQYVGAYPLAKKGSMYERITNAGLRERLEDLHYGRNTTSDSVMEYVPNKPMLAYVPSRAGDGMRLFAIDNSLTIDAGLITVSDNTLVFNLNEENIQDYYSDIMLSDLHIGTLIETVSKIWNELNGEVPSDNINSVYTDTPNEPVAVVTVTDNDQTVTTLRALKERLIAQQQLIEHRLALIEQLLETY